MTACSLHRKDKEKKIALHTYQPDLLHFRKITYEFNPNKKKKAQVRTGFDLYGMYPHQQRHTESNQIYFCLIFSTSQKQQTTN